MKSFFNSPSAFWAILALPSIATADYLSKLWCYFMADAVHFVPLAALEALRIARWRKVRSQS